MAERESTPATQDVRPQPASSPAIDQAKRLSVDPVVLRESIGSKWMSSRDERHYESAACNCTSIVSAESNRTGIELPPTETPQVAPHEQITKQPLYYYLNF